MTPDPTAATAAPRMRAHWIVLFLSLFLGTQPVTTDLYLPSLPSLTAQLSGSMAQAQLTLSGLLLAFGISQLVWGPLSDRFGRRPIVILGFAMFSAASLGSIGASTMESLIGWRALQGVGMGAAVMVARAMTRDLFEPQEGARMMSRGLTGLGVIALMSPTLGGLLGQSLGWRSAMAALTVFGLLGLATVVWKFQETLATPKRDALQLRPLLAAWKHITLHRTFWAFALLSATSYGGLFTFLASSSFVFIQVLGVSKTAYGFLMATASLAYIGGTFFCRHMLTTRSVAQVVKLGSWITLVSASALVLLAALDVRSVWAILVPFSVFMVGHGIHQPCGQAGIAGPFPQMAGTASALGGCFMMVCAFAMSWWLAAHMDGSTRPLAYGVGFWALLIVITAWTLVQTHDRPQATGHARS